MSITNRKIGRSDIHEVPQLLREMRLTSMAKELEKKLEDPTSNIFTVQEAPQSSEVLQEGIQHDETAQRS